MCATSSAARSREPVAKPSRSRDSRAEPRIVQSNAGSTAAGGADFSYMDLGDSARVAVMITPRGRGPFREQAGELLSSLRTILAKQPEPMAITVQTVFLKDPLDQAECAQMLAEFSGPDLPVTNYVRQPPCCGAALALEAWAIGGKGVLVEHFGPHALAVAYDGVRWVYCAGIEPAACVSGVYPQALEGLALLHDSLVRAGSSFDRVVRTWLYLGGITELEGGVQRYQELNRARTDFYRHIRFHRSSPEANAPRAIYPASTGIGMGGNGLVLSCLALETRRDDLFLLPLENPRQTPAYAYDANYSAQSPKFSRAVALVLGNYVTTWVSGTASIVNAESCYPGDAARQTAQTIDNIERLIAAENFSLHGLGGAGASLHDLAKIRVYLKHPADLAQCRSICERRFGAVPAIYAVGDICRPELLVEIEGVAFSRCSRPETTSRPGAPRPLSKS